MNTGGVIIQGLGLQVAEGSWPVPEGDLLRLFGESSKIQGMKENEPRAKGTERRLARGKRKRRDGKGGTASFY